MNIKITKLGKKYSSAFWGLKNFTLEAKPGVLGLLGPNGAGKSTLMKILATVTRPTEGTIFWNDVDACSNPNKIREILGYLPQDFGIYPNLNAIEFLTYLGAARGLSGNQAKDRINQLLDLVNMFDMRKRKLGSLSGGMKQRIGIAQALLNDPKLLIVDEPTAGLDPEERIRFRNLLSELSGDRIVLLSSHIVSDLEAAATSIAIMNKGRLISHDAPEYLVESVKDKVWEMIAESDNLDELGEKHIIGNRSRNSGGIKVRLIGDGSPHESATAVSPNLEDAYLYHLHRNQDQTINA